MECISLTLTISQDQSCTNFSVAEVQVTNPFDTLQPKVHKLIRDSAMESGPPDGKNDQAGASAPNSEPQTKTLDTEAELSKLTLEL